MFSEVRVDFMFSCCLSNVDIAANSAFVFVPIPRADSSRFQGLYFGAMASCFRADFVFCFCADPKAVLSRFLGLCKM